LKIGKKPSRVKRSYGRRLVSAPGRIDFLNTHQDYKGLPVVPVAVKLRCYSTGSVNESNYVRFASLNLREQSEEFQDEFRLDDTQLRRDGWFGDYVRAVFNSLAGSGYETRGMDITTWSEVPIGSGLSSSAALEVSVTKLCATCLGHAMSAREIAEVAYRAEHDIMGIPCGRLDQYSSSFGGIINLQTRPPFSIEQLDWADLTFVIADSGQHRRIASIHPVRQAEIDEALKILMDEAGIPSALARKLGYHYCGPRWEDISETEISPFLSSLPARLANRILFTIKMQLSTSYALGVLKGLSPLPLAPASLAPVLKSRPKDPLSVLGAIMDYQHYLLRDFYEVSSPRLESVRDELIDLGVLGAKISGAGLGGTIIGLVRDQKAAHAVIKECGGSGITECWSSTPAHGVRVEPNRIWSTLNYNFAAAGNEKN
jgi:galactokinase